MLSARRGLPYLLPFDAKALEQFGKKGKQKVDDVNRDILAETESAMGARSQQVSLFKF